MLLYIEIALVLFCLMPQVVFALLTLISPGLILIDHGHFQYSFIKI